MVARPLSQQPLQTTAEHSNYDINERRGESVPRLSPARPRHRSGTVPDTALPGCQNEKPRQRCNSLRGFTFSAGPAGLEPAAPGFGARCSTTCATDLPAKMLDAETPRR